MEAYLSETLENLKSNKYKSLMLVLGNESCDLDSAVCAVVYAAFLYWQHNQIKCKVCTKGNRDESVYVDDIFVPVLNVDRADYDLKTEVAFCLTEHGISADKLVFRDDYDLQQLTSKPKTSVTLVDHHVMAKKDEFLVPLVTEIIDHRPVDKKDWKYKDDTRSTIELVGSCCTLVTQRIRDIGRLMSKETDFFSAYPKATDLLHCGIILDTVNFSKEVNKATPMDVKTAEFLESFLKPTSPEDDRAVKLERLVRARKEVSQLSGAQLLRKDVKTARGVLVPSFPILVQEFLRKADAQTAVAEALRRTECSIALLLGMSLTDGLVRDAAVISPTDPEKATKLANHLQQWKTPPLQLTSQKLPHAPQVTYFTQNNLSASRKQYLPALMDFLTS